MKPMVLASLSLTGLLCAQGIPSAALHGRALDPEGKPAAKVLIEMTSASEGRWSTISGEDGAFGFGDLKPGAYVLSATPDAKPRVQDGDRIVAVRTYFPSVPEEAAAEQIAVKPGADLSGYEIRLRTALVHRVRGVVLDRAGKVVEHTAVLLFKPATGPHTMISGAYSVMIPRQTPAQFAVAITDENGAFEFPSVLVGDWRVSVEPDVGGVSVGVSKQDIDNVEIHLSTFVTLDTLAEWGEAAASENGPSPDVTLIALDEPQLTQLSKSHRFEDLVPGRYLIVTQAGRTPGYYLASVFLGSHNVTGQEVELGPGSPPVKVVYKNDGGTVRGTVAEGEHSVVLLIPQGSADRNTMLSTTMLSATILSARCGPGGAFVINDVPPGDYYAAAFESLDVANAGFMKSIVADAARVHVDAKSAVTVNPAIVR